METMSLTLESVSPGKALKIVWHSTLESCTRPGESNSQTQFKKSAENPGENRMKANCTQYKQV